MNNINQNKTALIIGATSSVAMSVINLLAQKNYELYLIARNQERLDTLKKDLEAKHAEIKITTQTIELTDQAWQENIIQQAQQTLGNIGIALIAYGALPSDNQTEHSFNYSMQNFHINGTSTIGYLNLLTPIFQQQKHGTIAVISSVAGDRGRKSNFLYGSAKAAVSAYSSGLRAYLSNDGVNVLTIKPGFIDTPMTAHITQKGLLWAKPDKVAKDIVTAIEKKKSVLYTPGYWRLIMCIVKHIPEGIFKKLNF